MKLSTAPPVPRVTSSRVIVARAALMLGVFSLCCGLIDQAALFGADTAQDAAVKKDLENFQGVWTVESMDLDGKPLTEEQRKKIKLSIKGENFTFDNGSGAEPGSYKIDPSKNPKELNIVISEGQDKGKIYLVIYKFENGKMIQCMQLDNKKRPTEFTGKAGSGCAGNLAASKALASCQPTSSPQRRRRMSPIRWRPRACRPTFGCWDWRACSTTLPARWSFRCSGYSPSLSARPRPRWE